MKPSKKIVAFLSAYADKEKREVFLNEKLLLPEKSLKLVNHSPTGFAWGYGGSGPAQMALAILLELLPQETALKNYQIFKEKILVQVEPHFFEIQFQISIFEDGTIDAVIVKSEENEGRNS